MHGWQSTRAEVIKDTQPDMFFRDEVVAMDRIAMKSRSIIIPASLQDTTLDQLYVNHMGIERTRLLIQESIYWININADIQNVIETCPASLHFQATQPKDKMLLNETPGRPCKSVGANILSINNKQYLFIVLCTGGSHLSQIFWEHENQSGLLVIQLIYIKLYRKKETKFWKNKSRLSGNPA